MIVVIKTDKDVDKLKKTLAKRQTKKFDAMRFCGALKTDEDALAVQLRLRNEWN